MCLREHKANPQQHSPVHGGPNQALPCKQWLCTAAPMVPTYHWELMQQNQNLVLIHHLSKLPGTKASWGDQLFGLARWAHNGGMWNVHNALSRCHFTSPLLSPGAESLRNQIPGHVQSLQDHELFLSCIRCCNTLPCLLSLGHRLHVSLPPPDPNYLNKQPGHISDSLKIMMTWPWLACSDFLAVYWA